MSASNVSVKSLLQTFCFTSTLGIRWLSSSTQFAKFAWVLIIIGAMVGIVYATSIQIDNYFRYPTKVHISINSAERLPFPAVTVCNMNPVPRSKLLCNNYDLATVDEYISKYVEQLAQKDTSKSNIKLLTEPVSKCHEDYSQAQAKPKRAVSEKDPQTLEHQAEQIEEKNTVSSITPPESSSVSPNSVAISTTATTVIITTSVPTSDTSATVTSGTFSSTAMHTVLSIKSNSTVISESAASTITSATITALTSTDSSSTPLHLKVLSPLDSNWTTLTSTDVTTSSTDQTVFFNESSASIEIPMFMQQGTVCYQHGNMITRAWYFDFTTYSRAAMPFVDVMDLPFYINFWIRNYITTIVHFECKKPAADAVVDNAKCSPLATGKDITPGFNNLISYRALSMEDCCSKCCADPRCLSYIWWDQTIFHVTWCYLKSVTGPLGPSTAIGTIDKVHVGLSNDICRPTKATTPQTDATALPSKTPDDAVTVATTAATETDSTEEAENFTSTESPLTDAPKYQEFARWPKRLDLPLPTTSSQPETPTDSPQEESKEDQKSNETAPALDAAGKADVASSISTGQISIGITTPTQQPTLKPSFTTTSNSKISTSLASTATTTITTATTLHRLTSASTGQSDQTAMTSKESRIEAALMSTTVEHEVITDAEVSHGFDQIETVVVNAPDFDTAAITSVSKSDGITGADRQLEGIGPGVEQKATESVASVATISPGPMPLDTTTAIRSGTTASHDLKSTFQGLTTAHASKLTSAKKENSVDDGSKFHTSARSVGKEFVSRAATQSSTSSKIVANDAANQAAAIKNSNSDAQASSNLRRNLLYESLFASESGEFLHLFNDSVLNSMAFRDNFGTLANSALYRKRILAFMRDYNATIYQAILHSLQLDDLHDAHELIYLTLDEVKQLAEPMEAFILQCIYNGIRCNISQSFYRIYNHMYGFCYTFNSGFKGQISNQLRFGPGSGLKLTLASNKDEYNGALADAYGVRVSIHASGVDGHPDADGYIANVGETTQIAVRYQNRSKLPAPHESHCQSMYPQEFIDYGLVVNNKTKYTLTTCKVACIDYYYLKALCGCVYYRPESGSQQCQILNTTQTWCRIGVLWQFQAVDNKLTCPCSSPCEEDLYLAKLTSTPIKSTVLSSYSANPNIAQIQVYFESMEYQTIAEEPAFTITDLLANLGGIFGLYLGASVCSAFELCELISALIIHTFRRLQRNVND